MTVSPAVPSTRARQPQRGWYKRNEIAITPWLFLLPAMLFFAIYVIIPDLASRSGFRFMNGTVWAKRNMGRHGQLRTSAWLG